MGAPSPPPHLPPPHSSSCASSSPSSVSPSCSCSCPCLYSCSCIWFLLLLLAQLPLLLALLLLFLLLLLFRLRFQILLLFLTVLLIRSAPAPVAASQTRELRGLSEHALRAPSVLSRGQKSSQGAGAHDDAAAHGRGSASIDVIVDVTGSESTHDFAHGGLGFGFGCDGVPSLALWPVLLAIRVSSTPAATRRAREKNWQGNGLWWCLGAGAPPPRVLASGLSSHHRATSRSDRSVCAHPTLTPPLFACAVIAST